MKHGRVPGVYSTWSECEAQTKGFSGAIFKSFATKHEAQSYSGNGSQCKNSAGVPREPPTKRSGEVCNSLFDNKKRSPVGDKKVTANKKQKHGELLKITIYFDGASRGNPGIAGAGAFLRIERNGSPQKDIKIRKFLGTKETNNVAEYSGLIEGLQQALSYIQGLTFDDFRNLHSIHVEIFGDSNLIINQVNRVYQCKNPKLIPLYDECCRVSDQIADFCGRRGLVLGMTFEHVYRNSNAEADDLANEAIDKQKSWVEVIDKDQSKEDSGFVPPALCVGVCIVSRCVGSDESDKEYAYGQI